jgi:hypothetical protein
MSIAAEVAQLEQSIKLGAPTIAGIDILYSR